MLDIYNLSVLVFAVLVAVCVYFDRKSFRRESIVLLRRTQTGKNFITKLGLRFSRFWKLFGDAGVAIGFAASVWVFTTLIENLYKALFVPKTGLGAGLAFVIPWPAATPTAGPGFLAVPFWYWIISIALLVVVHEGLHGVMSSAAKVKIKSLGWGLLAIIPLAFVEPDEKALAKKGFAAQQRVFAAGSYANFILAGICILLTTLLFLPLYQPAGLVFSTVIKDYPAASLNITGAIVNLGGYGINTPDDLSAALEKIGPNKEVILRAKVYNLSYMPPVAHISPQKPLDVSPIILASGSGQTNEYKITTAANPQNPSRGYIGIAGITTVSTTFVQKELLDSLSFVQGLLFFLFLINFGVGLANLLPLKPLDGGRMWEIVFQRISKKHSKQIVSLFAYLTLFLIMANFIAPYI